MTEQKTKTTQEAIAEAHRKLELAIAKVSAAYRAQGVVDEMAKVGCATDCDRAAAKEAIAAAGEAIMKLPSDWGDVGKAVAEEAGRRFAERLAA